MDLFALIVIGLVGNFLCASPGAAQKLTRDEALQRTLEFSEELRISAEWIRISRLQAQEADRRRLPQLDFGGSYLYTSEVMSFKQPPMTVNIPGLGSAVTPGRETRFGDNHSADFKLQVTQPLFTGFRLRNSYRVAQEGVRLQRAEYEKVRLQILQKTEEAYLQAQKAAALRSAAQLHLDRLRRHLEEAQERLAAGVVPEEVVARARFGVLQAQQKLRETENLFDLAQLNLREILDLPDSAEELQLDSLEASRVDLPSQAEDFALRHRPEFKALEAQTAAALHKTAVEHAAYYPAFSAFGIVDYGRPGIDKIANEWMLYEMIGVNVSWTLWDWNIRKTRVEQARAAQRQLQETEQLLRSSVRLQWSQAQKSLDDATRKLEIAEEGARLARDVLKWVEARYAEGVATEREFQDAQDAVASSDSDRIAALADYHLAQTALKYALGVTPPQTESFGDENH
jgi:outer membrane protein TolC